VPKSLGQFSPLKFKLNDWQQFPRRVCRLIPEASSGEPDPGSKIGPARTYAVPKTLDLLPILVNTSGEPDPGSKIGPARTYAVPKTLDLLPIVVR
jgi:hypothetical protein